MNENKTADAENKNNGGNKIDRSENELLNHDDFLESVKFMPLKFSYGFRTPISNTMAIISELEKYLLKNSTKKYINLAEAANEELCTLMRNVIQMESLYNLDKLEKSIIDMKNFFNEFCKKAADLLKEKGFEFKYTNVKEPVFACVDVKYFEIALLNLITNSCTHSSKENKQSKNISASFSAEDKIITVKISDNSGGIPPEILNKTFGDYINSSAAHMNYYGMGLGLHIIKKIIHMHDGRFNIDSIQGKGTAAVISLPVHESSSASVLNDEKPNIIRNNRLNSNISVYINSLAPYKR